MSAATSETLFREVGRAMQRSPESEAYIEAIVRSRTGFAVPLDFQRCAATDERIKAQLWRECLALVLNAR